jgi:hypothetical protein
MRQEIVTKTYLKFNELNNEQQNKVIDYLSDINVIHDWYEYIYDEYTTKLQKLGFYDIKIQFSGFCCQGDGASFSAKHKRGTVYTTSRYSHSGTMSCDESEILLTVAKRLADNCYKSLECEYEHLTSRESIIETIECNEYEFDSESLKII